MVDTFWGVLRYGHISPWERGNRMCDRRTRNGSQCQKESDFMVLVHVVPQDHTYPDGTKWSEGMDAHRMVTVCAVHLVQAVRELHRLPIKRYSATVQVRPIR